MSFEPGDFVGVSCTVQPGPFEDEMVIAIETTDGIISGFVSRNELRQIDGRWEVRGKVRRVMQDAIEVWIIGSFFTTNGIASIPTRLAMAA